MPSFLQRYLTGERREVWADLVALGANVRSSTHFGDASGVAAETMRRVRHNVEMVHERLRQLGYTFIAPDQAHMPPSSEAPTMLAEIERLRGPIPLSLRAFYEIVGSVDFQQSRKQLIQYWEEERASASELNLLGEEDPLVVAPVKDLLSEVRAYAPTKAKRVGFTFAPDEFHKAHYSGGENYHLWLPNANADFRVEGMYEINEYFVAYLRATFATGGFRGRVEELPDNVQGVRKVPPKLQVTDDLARHLMPI